MAIIVTCQKCGTRLSAPESAVGKFIKCPKPDCGTLTEVQAFLPVEEVPVVDAVPAVKNPRQSSSDDETEPPRKKPRRDDEDDDRPRGGRRYADDDDFDRPRRPRRRSGPNAGVIAAIALAVLAILAGAGIGIYALARKTGDSTRAGTEGNSNSGGGGANFPGVPKAPVPPGWKKYTYSADRFQAYFPSEPKVVTIPVFGTGGPGGFPGMPELGDVGRVEGTEIEQVESYSTYGCGKGSDAMQIGVMILRYSSAVPDSARARIRNFRPGEAGIGRSRSINWLGYDAIEFTTAGSITRGVYTDRTMIMATITGQRFGRARAEDEKAFFDNFELVR